MICLCVSLFVDVDALIIVADMSLCAGTHACTHISIYMQANTHALIHVSTYEHMGFLRNRGQPGMPFSSECLDVLVAGC